MPDLIRVVDAGSYRRVAFLGGIYSNYLALQEALKLARAREVEAIFALGDFGAFGPHPDRTVEILRREGIPALQGNDEESLSSAAADCHCGYTDPRDNHFAQISYDYTRDRTAAEHKRWMGELPGNIRLRLGERQALLCHGSPRTINEFLWRSLTPPGFPRRWERAARGPALEIESLEVALEGRLWRLRVDLDGGLEPGWLASAGDGLPHVPLDVQAKARGSRGRLGEGEGRGRVGSGLGASCGPGGGSAPAAPATRTRAAHNPTRHLMRGKALPRV